MGEKLKILRLEKKYTQKQIAERTGVAISAISSYEAGIRYPSYETLVKLARIYHVSTDYLIGITDNRTLDVSDLNEEEIAVVSNMVEILRKKH